MTDQTAVTKFNLCQPATFANDFVLSIAGGCVKITFFEHYGVGGEEIVVPKGTFVIPMEALIVMKNALVEHCQGIEGQFVRN